ncbi:MAG: 3-keto-disaccharide hydrolase [Bacteroidota bacterium]
MKTMKQYALIRGFFAMLLILLISVVQLNAQQVEFPPERHPNTDNWQKLFADDLSNAIDQDGIWSFEDDILTATEDGVIFTEEEYDNYLLDLEFKFGEHANSGVIVHTSNYEDWIPNSVEIQIYDDHSMDDPPSKTSCGAIFGHLAPEKSVVNKPGEWNRMTVGCKGQMIYVVLNGEPIIEFDMSRYTSSEKNPDGSEIFDWLSTPKAELPTEGKVGFQGKHGDADIYFRNLKIKEF